MSYFGRKLAELASLVRSRFGPKPKPVRVVQFLGPGQGTREVGPPEQTADSSRWLFPPMKVESSNLDSVAYDPGYKTLEIVFKNAKGPKSKYHYFDVPQSVFQALMWAASKGRFHYNQIRLKEYQYERLA